MSATTKELIKITVVTDHDCDNYKIGELQAGYRTSDLEQYIKDYGFTNLIITLSRLTHEVLTIRDKLKREEMDKAETAKVSCK